MERIYFLVPNIEITKKIVDVLLLDRVEERHIHVLAKRNTPLENLPEASFLQKSDFIPALEQGMAVGGLAGIALGVFGLAFIGDIKQIGMIILVCALAGVGFGAWVSSMVGSSIGSRRLKQFAEAIEKGGFLMMIDVPAKRVERVEQLVKARHPEASHEGTEINPSFP